MFLLTRVPGDIDDVNALKIQMNRGEKSPKIKDPHVAASALKLWFRELADPIVPADLYDACINVSGIKDVPAHRLYVPLLYRLAKTRYELLP